MRAKHLIVAASLFTLTACGPMFGNSFWTATISGPATLNVGASAQYLAQVSRDGKSTETPTGPAGRPLAWTTSDSEIAAITDTGLVTGVRPGTVTITAAPIVISGTSEPGSLVITIVE